LNKSNFKSYGISEEILNALTKLQYEKPTEVQERVIPRALEGRDIIVKSQTGSGKTAAFGIPICEKIDIEDNKPQALILTPTRELCVQVKEDITNIGRFKKVRCAAVYGKHPFSAQERELKQRVHVIAGTPGRTLDHLERGTMNLDEIKYLVIDEADEMLNMGFMEEMEAILSKLPKNRITMLFSATIPPEIESLCHKYIKNPLMIEINPENLTTERIKHIYYRVKENDKYNVLIKVMIMENPDSCIIFCRTKENVGNLTAKLQMNGYPSHGLHGGMMQNDRFDVMNSFKRGEFTFLVATDVAARGIDVESITHIINYDIPLEKESYVHRTGRTGRAEMEGKAISFVTPYEDRFLSEIEDYIGFKIRSAEEPGDGEVEKAKAAFFEKIEAGPKLKEDKSHELNKEITKIYINAGKKKKMRTGDIVGAITNIPGVKAEDIGIIDILDHISYIDILNGKGDIVLKALETINMKGKPINAQRAVKR